MDFDQLVFYFFFYSFLGFLLETIYRSIASKRLVYPGFLLGPYCPIYGFGLIAVVLLLQPLKDNLWLFLPAAFIVTSVLEYFTGYMLEKLLGLRLWDYNNKLLNIKGRISVEFSIYWTILAYLFIHFVHPIFLNIPKLLESIGIFSMLKYVIIPILAIDFLFTVNKAIYTRKKISALDLLLNEMEELKDNAGDRLETLRSDYDALLSKILNANRNFSIYRISSNRFPRVVQAIKDARKGLKFMKWFKEDK